MSSGWVIFLCILSFAGGVSAAIEVAFRVVRKEFKSDQDKLKKQITNVEKHFNDYVIKTEKIKAGVIAEVEDIKRMVGK